MLTARGRLNINWASHIAAVTRWLIVLLVAICACFILANEGVPAATLATGAAGVADVGDVLGGGDTAALPGMAWLPALPGVPDAPVREPAGLADCYGARPAGPTKVPLLAASPGSLLSNCLFVSYYGYPGVPGLGVLGQADPETSAARLAAQVDVYAAAQPSRQVVGALEVIAAVAQDVPGDDGSYLYRMPRELVEQELALAEEHNLLVILDLQMGQSTVEREVSAVLPYLDNPRVQLALDPEWAMPEGVVPGTQIGGMDAAAINRAQEMVQGYVGAHGLGRKLLVVHQFTDGMIRDREQLKTYPGIDLLIDTDGFGLRQVKLANYQQYIAASGAPHGGMKLFYKDDIDLLPPAEALALVPQPDLIIYQ